MTLQLEVLQGDDVFEQTAVRWQQLLDRCPDPDVFLRPEYLRDWQRLYARDRQCFLIVAAEGGEWLAGLPLALGVGQSGRWRVRKLELAGMPFTDWWEMPALHPQAAVEFLHRVLAWAMTELRRFTLLDLRELATEGLTAKVLHRVLNEKRLRHQVRLCSRAPCLQVPVAGGAVKRSSNLRSQLRRSEKRLRERGSLDARFEAVGNERCEQLIEECARVEADSWKGEQNVGVLTSEESRPLFAAFWRRHAEQGELLLGSLRLDDQLIAYHWGVRHGDRFFSYNLAHHADFHAAGAGTYLMDQMAEQAHGLGLAILDASRGSLSKPHLLQRYHGPYREHVQFLIYNRNLAGRLVGFSKTTLLPLLRRGKARG